MNRRWLMLLLLLACARPGAAAEVTVPVTIHSFLGLPADSSDRYLFMQGFHATMDADLPCEFLKGDAWTSSGPRRNTFRLVDAASPDETWWLELSIGIPPTVRVKRPRAKHSKAAQQDRMSDVRTSRGLVISVAALSPSEVESEAHPTPLHFTLYFADSRRILVPSAQVPSGGYEYSWTDAGRVVALAALEALHRGVGDLADNERADLEPATRMEVTE